MGKRLLHTPEGVRDIYGKEYAEKLALQHRIHTTFQSYGFCDIQTPTFEFFDVYSKEIGTTPSKELYKFFDKEGNTLVLRPDFTPSMARCAAKYFMEEPLPIRFSYVGNTFTNTSDLQGKLKEVTQMGTEYIGDAGVEADAEMISLVIESLKNAGLSEFQVSIGQVEFFKGLCADVGLDEETELELRDFISNKNYFGAEELLQEKNISTEHTEVILKVTDIFGSIEDLKEAKNLVSNTRSIQAILELEALYDILSIYGVEQYVSFDLGMLSNYNYYTGVIFKAYTYGIGDAFVTGGRYDNLLSRFGKNAPAIGFMIIIDALLSAFQRQKIAIPTSNDTILLLYHKEEQKEAIEMAKTLRKDKYPVQMHLMDAAKTKEDYMAYSKTQSASKIITVKEFSENGDYNERY